MGGRFCSIDRTLVKIRGVARILQRERLFWKFDPILFDLQKKRSSPKFKRFFWPKSQIQGFFPAKNMWSPKKRSSPNFKRFFCWPKSQIQEFFLAKNTWSPKKKKKGLRWRLNCFFLHHYSRAIWFYIWPDFGRLFLSSTIAQISMGDAQSRWGDVQSR